MEGGVGGARHMGVALIILPGYLVSSRGDTERNHVPVLQLFQRIHGQEEIGRNLARWVDRHRQKEAATAGQGAGQHHFDFRGSQHSVLSADQQN